jgi:hypothetical protein
VPIGPLPAELTGEQLRTLDCDPRMVGVAFDRDVREGEVFPCVMPGHAGGGVLARKQDGRHVYRCDCDSIERSLTEVYMARVTGVRRKRGLAEFLLWRIRHAAKAGIISLPRQELPACPRGADDATVAVYRGIGLFLRARQLTEQRGEETFTFTAGFTSEWCRVTPEEAKQRAPRARQGGRARAG